MRFGRHRDEEKKEVTELGKTTPYISFLEGNAHDPVLVVGEDVSTADSEKGTEATNLLVVKLGRAESISKESVRDEETTDSEKSNDEVWR